MDWTTNQTAERWEMMPCVSCGDVVVERSELELKTPQKFTICAKCVRRAVEAGLLLCIEQI